MRLAIRNAVIAAASLILATGIGLTGFGVGAAVSNSITLGEENGYQIEGTPHQSCNIGVTDGKTWIEPDSQAVTAYHRSDVYAANLGCTNDEIADFNAAAAGTGSRDRVCRFDGYFMLPMINEDEPMSCASIVKSR